MAIITEPYSDLKKKYVRLMKDEKSKCISFEKYLKQITFLKQRLLYFHIQISCIATANYTFFFIFSRPKTNLQVACVKHNMMYQQACLFHCCSFNQHLYDSMLCLSNPYLYYRGHLRFATSFNMYDVWLYRKSVVLLKKSSLH